MNQLLKEHLLTIPDNTLYGIMIHEAFKSGQEEELVKTLKKNYQENPAVMERIIGLKGCNLLNYDPIAELKAGEIF